MSRIQLLVICPPGHPSLALLDALAGAADISITDEPEEAARLARTAEVILFSGLAGASVALPTLWPEATAVRWVHTLSAGVDRMLFPELVASAAVLTNARGVFKRSLAEFAVLGMLFHLKQVRRLVAQQRRRLWEDFSVRLAEGRVMGIVGYGDIGRECGRLASGLGLTIHALRRHPAKSVDDDLPARLFAPDQLHDMLSGVDVLVCAAPLTPATHHLIGEPEFRVMKPTAILVNVGRGPVIDESALVRALRDGRIAAASLDVFEQEPLAADSPLWDMDNVLLSPHCADRTVDPDWLDLSMQFFVENFARYRHGQPLTNVVDKQAGY